MTRQNRHILLAALALGLLLQTSAAQTGSGASGGRGGGGTRSGTTPSTRTTPSSPSGGELRREFFFTGKVMLEDGTPPPEPVAIEVVCATSRMQQTYTDAKGKFGFRLGDHQEVMGDASIGAGEQDVFGNGLGSSSSQVRAPSTTGSQNRLMGCDLHVALVGYRSDDISLSQRRAMDNPDLGTIVLHRLANVQGSAISLTSLQAPNDARSEYEKGGEALTKRKWGEARKHFEKAVEIYPKYSVAWFYLGVAALRQKGVDDAQAAFSKSIEADPTFVRPYLASAQIAFQQKKWAEVVDYTEKLIKLDPVDFPQAYLFNAMAYGGLNNLTAAEKSAREAVKLDSAHRYPRAEYILGFILSNKQDYAGAIQYMRSYVERVPDAPDVETIKREIAQMEKSTGTAAATAKP